MKHPKHVWIDFTYYDSRRKDAPIAAWFYKADPDFKKFILVETKRKKKKVKP